MQCDNVGPDKLKLWESPQVWMENIHRAEDAGLLIRDPRRIKFRCVLWRKEIPALPADNKHSWLNSILNKDQTQIIARI